ncbi:amidohydrolase [Acidisphaera sp. L21]|uniref:amidohydrolase family protein n=1 Tax=Acidisphaera sp. L21 TaxID=1641851 RepID=UPI00131E2C23|nr:amidohydrolase family protein [Acidisphaera sp. L21]
MSVFDEPKVDCHLHILDPARFPYVANTPFHPAGQEIATAAQMNQVFAAYGIRNALLVQPNSGYGDDNQCLLATIAESSGRVKGVAFVPLDISLTELQRLKSNGIIGIAFNVPFHGVPYYLGAAPLLEKLMALDLMLQVQIHEDQLLALLPMLLASRVRLLIDHCGRPTVQSGLQQPAFQALLDLGRRGRAAVKLSGYVKFSQQPHPFTDTWPFVAALVDAFGLDACVWGSDWPFLRAPQRVDYGPLLTLMERLFPQAADRRKVFWETPRRLFEFKA